MHAELTVDDECDCPWHAVLVRYLLLQWGHLQETGSSSTKQGGFFFPFLWPKAVSQPKIAFYCRQCFSLRSLIGEVHVEGTQPALLGASPEMSPAVGYSSCLPPSSAHQRTNKSCVCCSSNYLIWFLHSIAIMHWSCGIFKFTRGGSEQTAPIIRLWRMLTRGMDS